MSTSQPIMQEYHVILTILGRDGLPETFRDILSLTRLASDSEKLREVMLEWNIWPRADILFYRIVPNRS